MTPSSYWASANSFHELEYFYLLLICNIIQFTPPGGDDDAFIIEFAFQSDGWIVSNDNYREFLKQVP